MFNFNRILFLGAHPDDLEFAAGGLIAKVAKMRSVEFQVAVFSNCDASLAPEFPSNTLINELYESMESLN